MKYAVVKIGGRQFRVAEGEEFELTASPEDKGEVLLVVDGDKVEIGQPTLGEVVSLEVVSRGKGEKIHIRRYRAKSRYRRHIGFRPVVTKYRVVGIGSTEEPKPKKVPRKVAGAEQQEKKEKKAVKEAKE